MATPGSPGPGYLEVEVTIKTVISQNFLDALLEVLGRAERGEEDDLDESTLDLWEEYLIDAVRSARWYPEVIA